MLPMRSSISSALFEACEIWNRVDVDRSTHISVRSSFGSIRSIRKSFSGKVRRLRVHAMSLRGWPGRHWSTPTMSYPAPLKPLLCSP